MIMIMSMTINRRGPLGVWDCNGGMFDFVAVLASCIDWIGLSHHWLPPFSRIHEWNGNWYTCAGIIVKDMERHDIIKSTDIAPVAKKYEEKSQARGQSGRLVTWFIRHRLSSKTE